MGGEENRRDALFAGTGETHCLPIAIVPIDHHFQLHPILASLYLTFDLVTISGLFATPSQNTPMITQYLTDERGEKVAVVIPIADYDDLTEGIADLACVAERRDDSRISLAELKRQLTF